MHLVPKGKVVKGSIDIVVKVAHKPSFWQLFTPGSIHFHLSPLQGGHDEKGRIAPHEPKRQPLIEVSGGWLVQSSCL